MAAYPIIELADTLYALEAVDYPDAAPEAHDEHLLGVLAQIADERWRQIGLGYDHIHDDIHAAPDLLHQVRTQIALAHQETTDEGYRERLIQVAAVAVAAVQAWDRFCADVLAETAHG